MIYNNVAVLIGALRVNTHRIFKRLAKVLIRLRVCTGWSEPLLVTHTTLFESHVVAHVLDIRPQIQVWGLVSM